MAIKKRIVQIENNTNSVLYAINSNFDEFRFCNIINEEFGINLQIQSPCDYELSHGKIISHSYYSFIDSNRKIQFDLISNKIESGVLIDFLDSIHYFIRVSSALVEMESDSIQRRILSLESVIFIQKLQLSIFSIRQRKQLQHLFL